MIILLFLILLKTSLSCSIIAAGERHLCLLFASSGKNSSFVRCVGSNDVGQLGTGQGIQVQYSFNNSADASLFPPSTFAGLSVDFVTEIHSRAQHNVAITDTKRAITWGYGMDGALGYGNGGGEDIGDNEFVFSAGFVNVSSTLPLTVSATVGHHHTCVVQRSHSEGGNRSLICFGRNAELQLGYSSSISEVGLAMTPAEFGLMLPLQDVVMAAGGGEHTIALAKLGSVFCMGLNSFGECGLGHSDAVIGPTSINVENEPASTENVAFVAAGRDFSALVYTNGKLIMFGRGANGQLGHKSTSSILRADYSHAVRLSESNTAKVQQVALGDDHTVVLLENQRVLAFGNGLLGKLGYGDHDSRGVIQYPWEAGWLALPPIIRVAAGSQFSCFIDVNYDLFCTGSNHFGLGSSTNFVLVPTKVALDGELLPCEIYGSTTTTSVATDPGTTTPPSATETTAASTVSFTATTTEPSSMTATHATAKVVTGPRSADDESISTVIVIVIVVVALFVVCVVAFVLVCLARHRRRRKEQRVSSRTSSRNSSQSILSVSGGGSGTPTRTRHHSRSSLRSRKRTPNDKRAQNDPPSGGIYGRFPFSTSVNEYDLRPPRRSGVGTGSTPIYMELETRSLDSNFNARYDQVPSSRESNYDTVPGGAEDTTVLRRAPRQSAT